MIVTIVTFNLPQPTTLAEITKTFQGTAAKYQGIAGLLRKNYFMSEDGKRAGGIYVWASRADADRVLRPQAREVRHASRHLAARAARHPTPRQRINFRCACTDITIPNPASSVTADVPP